MSTDTLTASKEKMTRTEIRLAVLASVVYFVNYLARYDFAASLLSMTATFGAKELLGIALTVSSVTYGAGQILTGILGDKIPPRFAVAAGLIGTGLCNLIVGLVSDPNVAIAVWGCNGLMQAMIWPSLVRQLAHDLSPYAYKKAIVSASVASSVASVLVYLAVVPFSITVSTWRLSFFLAAGIALAVGAVWFCSVRTLRAEKTDLSKIRVSEGSADGSAAGNGTSPLRLMFLSGIPVIFLMIACHGLLREGLGDWMPSLMSDTFGLEDVASVMSASIIPLFATVSVFVASKLYDIVKIEMKTCLILWTAGTAVTFCLYFFIDVSAIAAVLLLAILATCVHGINHIVTTRLQTHFKAAGLVSTVTGLLNSATYVGAAVSGYGIAVFSDRFGWKSTVLLWAFVAVLGFVLTLLVYKRWTKFAQTHS